MAGPGGGMGGHTRGQASGREGLSQVPRAPDRPSQDGLSTDRKPG